MIPLPPHDHTETSARKRKMFGSRRSTGVAGVGIVLKVGADGGLYVKSMQKKGPAWGSNVVQVGDLLLEVDGRDAFKPADKVKRMILGSPGTSCEILMKRWTCNGEESIIYSTSLVRTKLVADELDGQQTSNCQENDTGETAAVLAAPAPITPPRQSDFPCKGNTAISPKSLSPMKKAARAEGTGGIGIVFKVSREGAMVVKSMIPTGSASRSNLVQVGDALLKIDGKKMLGKPVEKMVCRVLGAVGSVADVQFQRRTNAVTGEPGAVYRVMLIRGITAEMEEDMPVVSPPVSNSRPNANRPELKSSLPLLDSTDDKALTSPMTGFLDLPGESSRNVSRKTISVLEIQQHDMVDQHKEHKDHARPQRSGPNTTEKNASVQGPISVLDSASMTGKSTTNSVTNSSPTEQDLKGRQGPHHNQAREDSRVASATMRLTLARSLADLTLSGQNENIEDFKQELLSELCLALSVSSARFRILHVSQTHTMGCIADVEILAADDGVSSDMMHEGRSLMPIQLALEVQRQVADPLAPLRNATWFSYVMNVVITSKPASVHKDKQGMGAPMPDEHFGAPLHFSVPSDFGSTNAPSRQLYPNSLLVDAMISGEDGALKQSEVLATAIEKQHQEKPSPLLVKSWLHDISAANRSSEGSEESLYIKELPRSLSMPELHHLHGAADSRSALEAHNMRLQVRIATKEQQEQALKTENDGLRARIQALEASEQRLIAEAKILKGLSVSQGKEIVAYQAQTRTLSTQLRDQRKQRRVSDAKAGNLSEVFSLEQQLHAEKARVVELTKALDRAREGADVRLLDAGPQLMHSTPRSSELPEVCARDDAKGSDLECSVVEDGTTAQDASSELLLDMPPIKMCTQVSPAASRSSPGGTTAFAMLSPRKSEPSETTAVVTTVVLVRKE